MRKVSMVVAAAAIAAAAILTLGSSSHDAVRTVDVTIHYSTFSVSNLSFPQGTTVRFVITNTDPIDHEFILGNRSIQHYMEVTDHPDHDGHIPGQISVPAGTTRTTTFTFGRPGPLLFGCHLPGHYRYGMRGTIAVT